MRTILYWLATTAFAVAMAHSSGQSAAGEAADLLWAPSGAADVLPVPEPSRAVLLGVGIMAIAFTYRKAWLNLKRKG
ncbi:PEP-CTERM protein-sorting domain-containing protein [Prosthecobacter debontii]|uniref:PEP-CTERM protein-sorting domain-containing protein n=1 Tax=Prosthecobacter debontii TaxID=48467 RepID=A0A1T4WSB0_9BACT|nr:PEP-CTERM sorting domain-containing protein [Prosthecobacter debontii]SKA80007.1 PEP-CTERM protein-sorting domain-containing protein [Prosthecobacter debontii]